MKIDALTYATEEGVPSWTHVKCARARPEPRFLGSLGRPDVARLRRQQESITAGLDAASAILAASRKRDMVSVEGKYVDLSLLDAEVAISQVATMYVGSGWPPPRMGGALSISYSWQSLKCTDSQIMVAVGNDLRFLAFCQVGVPELATDERFETNALRVKKLLLLVPVLDGAFKTRGLAERNAAFDDANVPSGLVNVFAKVLADPQIQHRNMLAFLFASGDSAAAFGWSVLR